VFLNLAENEKEINPQSNQQQQQQQQQHNNIHTVTQKHWPQHRGQPIREHFNPAPLHDVVVVGLNV